MKKPYKAALFLTLAALLCAGAVWGSFALFGAKPPARVSAASALAGAPVGGVSSGGAGSDILNLLPSSSQCFASTSSVSSSAQTESVSYGLEPCFLNTDTGFVEWNRNGEVYALLATGDGGKSWALRSREHLALLSFVSARAGYAASLFSTGESALVKTTDGGATWKTVNFPAPAWIGDIFTVGSETVYVAVNSDAPQLLRSSDGGASWTQLKLPVWKDASGKPQPVSGCSTSWLTPARGYLLEIGDGAMGSAGKALFYTADGGKTWALRSKAVLTASDGASVGSLPFSGSGAEIRFAPDGAGYLISNIGGLWRTSDGGIHFTELIKGTAGRPLFYSSSFFSAAGGFAAIQRENGETDLSRTSDGGRTWKTVVTGAVFAKLAGIG